MHHVKGVRPRRAGAGLPLPSQFIKTESGYGTDKRETGRQRKEQVEEIVERQLGDDDSADRIDDAEKDRMGRHRPEITDAFDERISEIRYADLPHHWRG